MVSTHATTRRSIFEDRLANAQVELRSAGVAAMMIGVSSDLRYLTGHAGHLSERLTLLVVPATGPVSVVVPVLEAPGMADKAGFLTVVTWEETEAPTSKVADLVGAMAGKSIAVGAELWSSFLLKLQAAIPGASWVDATAIMRELRMSKDEYEIAALAQAGAIVDAAWEEFIKTSIAGLTETEAMERLAVLTRERGLQVSGGICASGPNSASPHHHTGERVIEVGDAVVFDWGGTVDGYYADITRTAHIGEPSEEFVWVYDIVRRANQATLDAVQPGVACQDLDRVARKLISDEGYGEAFIHRVGHGLGLDIHEEPYLVEGNTMPLRTGMVFSDEPGIYLEGRFGVRIEDAVVCTETGGRRLNEATRDLAVMS